MIWHKKEESNIAILTSTIQSYKSFFQMLPPFHSVDLLHLLIQLEARASMQHQLGWRKERCIPSVFLLEKTHFAILASLITTEYVVDIPRH